MQQLLIIGFVWPEPNSSAAGSRMVQLIKLFQENNFKVTFASAAQESDFMIDLERLGVTKKSIVLNCTSFDFFVKELNPSVVLFDRFMIEEQFGWRVVENCPNALRILDTEDLHCLRFSRQKAVKENREFNANDLLNEVVAKREIASVLRCDISLFVSEFEIYLLGDIFKIDKSLLFYLPLFIDDNLSLDTEKFLNFHERLHFVFIGNFLHEPNWDAVQFLKTSIWNKIRSELPNVNLYIYGAYPSQKVLQLHNPKEGFYIMGRAEYSKEVIVNARVLLAPLRYGAGIKGKLLEAMQYGTPNVTTSIGIEGMQGNMSWGGYVEDNPMDFADMAVKLYKNKLIWDNAQVNGFDIIKKRFLKKLFAANFIENILVVQNNIEYHRLQNFIGSMLLHHSFASTKYMSKWIESKNNND